jgi:hypothetical protein
MGASASNIARPSRISSGETVLAETKDIREMSDALFTFMFKSWSLKEVWDIANKPEDYVIALSELIENQFDVIGYTTQRNQVGEIYFKKKDKLAPTGPGSPGYEKHKQNARTIAFYFIRLFQIMGALLMVIKDTQIPVFDERSQTNVYTQATAVSGRPMLNQGLPRFKYTGGGSFPKNISLGPYEFLRKYLQRPSSEDITVYQKFGADIDGKYKITPNLFFEYKFDIETNKKKSNPKDYTKSIFYILTKDSSTGSKEFARKDVAIEEISMGTGKPPTYISPANLDNDKDEKDLYPISVKIRLPTSGTRNPHVVQFTRIESRTNDWSGGADYVVSSGTIVDSLLGRMDRKDFTSILEEVVLAAVRQEKSGLRLYTIAATETSGKPSEIGKIPEKIVASSMINTILQNLKGTEGKKAQPHCIARALQLLDSKSIQQYAPGSGVTQICRFAAGDQKGPIGLDAYKPMKSVAQLFGKINPANFKESQKILEAFVGSSATMNPTTVAELKTMGQLEEATEMAAALDRLAKAFEFVNKGGPLDSFSQIQLSRPAECKTDGPMVIKSQQTTLQMQSAAQELFATHVKKSIEISRFLKMLFNIKAVPGDDGSKWKVEGPTSKILFGGFNILDELTIQARALLIDYYSECEVVYQKGVNAWRQSDQAKPPASNAKPAT